MIIAERNKYNDEVSLRDWNSGPRIAMRGFVRRADFGSWVLFEQQILLFYFLGRRPRGFSVVLVWMGVYI